MLVAADKLDALRVAALAQPGAVERTNGIKFQCPGCRDEGHDQHQDNAILFEGGTWGCAVAADTEVGRQHWVAIGRVLGAFQHPNGGAEAADPQCEASPAESVPWPAPKPVPNDLPRVPAFDDRLLPAAFVPWVRDVADRAQCPADFVAVAAVVALAAVVGRTIAIRPKRHDDWTVVPNLWGVCIGRPGIMKTFALGEALSPLHRLAAQAGAAHREAVAAHDFALAEAQARRDAVKKQLRKAATTGAPTEALRAAFEAAGAPPPTERRYVVNDSTVEKLGELLNENPRGLLLSRDELTGWLRTMDREGHENDRAFYCEAWNGTGAYTYDRIGRGTVHIEAACVSVLGGMQPGPLHAYLREAFGDGAKDDGLIQRFQLLVYPDASRAWRNVDRWPDTDAKGRVWDVFQALDRLDAEALAAHRPTLGDLPVLHFTPEAQALFDGWRATLEQRLREDTEHPVVVSHLAKYRSLMPSLALLFHLVDCIDRGAGGPVSEAAAKRAIDWCAYLEAHARRVYESVTAPSRMATAALAAHLKAGHLPSPFLAREVRRHGWTGLTEPAAAVDAAIDWLCDLHWLRREDVRPVGGGRPTAQYHINPAVLGAAR